MRRPARRRRAPSTGGATASSPAGGRRSWGWGGRAALPPIAAPKAVTGEYGGGLLGAAVLAAAGSPLGPTPGFAEPDPELGIVPHDGSPLPPPATVLVTSLAAGRAASWLVLGKS